MQRPVCATYALVTGTPLSHSCRRSIRLYYSGNSEGEDLKEILALVAKLNSDATVEQLEADYQLHCDRADLMADYYDSAWF